jgi:two-component system sensor histidine kinase KdpD
MSSWPSCRPSRPRPGAGKLRIYFGSNAGVGKTYAMLAAAQRERLAGRRVLVGLVETHGRAETEQQLHDLELLPRRTLAYQGRQLDEFDLDAAWHAARRCCCSTSWRTAM